MSTTSSDDDDEQTKEEERPTTETTLMRVPSRIGTEEKEKESIKNRITSNRIRFGMGTVIRMHWVGNPIATRGDKAERSLWSSVPCGNFTKEGCRAPLTSFDEFKGSKTKALQAWFFFCCVYQCMKDHASISLNGLLYERKNNAVCNCDGYNWKSPSRPLHESHLYCCYVLLCKIAAQGLTLTSICRLK